MQVGGVQGLQGAVPPEWGFHSHPPYFTQVGTAMFAWLRLTKHVQAPVGRVWTIPSKLSSMS